MPGWAFLIVELAIVAWIKACGLYKVVRAARDAGVRGSAAAEEAGARGAGIEGATGGT